MNFFHTDIPDVLLIAPKVYEDERGFFMETYRKESYEEFGIPLEFVQDNHSRSQQHVLRGLHYQVSHVQGKLVRVVNGAIFDVAVDLRRSSPTFGKWVGEVISAEKKNQIWIPPGFAHGFYTISKWADVLYKTTDYYNARGDRCIRWDDPELAIQWPIPDENRPILSKKDMEGSLFSDAEVFE